MLFYATVKEPRRGATDASPATPHEPHSLGDVLRVLYASKTFVFLSLASALNVFCIYGLLNWEPSFLARLHGMKSAQIGASLGLIYGIGGAIGSFAGGWLTDRFGKIDKSLYLKIPAYAIIISIPCAAGAIFLHGAYFSLACLGLVGLLQSTYLGPSLAVAHGLVPASMRALTSAVFFLVINLIGMGFGPTAVGMISDLLKPALGVESLRWAMSIVIVVSFASAMLFFNAAKKLNKHE